MLFSGIEIEVHVDFIWHDRLLGGQIVIAFLIFNETLLGDIKDSLMMGYPKKCNYYYFIKIKLIILIFRRNGYNPSHASIAQLARVPPDRKSVV